MHLALVLCHPAKALSVTHVSTMHSSQGGPSLPHWPLARSGRQYDMRISWTTSQR